MSETAGSSTFKPRRHQSIPVIPVTAEIIAASSQKSSSHCMIADAIRKAMPQMSSVSVDLQTIRFTDRAKGERYIYLTPEFAQRQLLRFDWGTVVEPWSLRLPSRPNQIVKVKASDPASANVAGRPRTEGSRKLLKDAVVTVVGGSAPALGPGAHSAQGGAGHRGLRRQFGMRLLTETFDPSK